jgi:lysophospholipid acyltransferase (LPLAT)-like uncharacterized protein
VKLALPPRLVAGVAGPPLALLARSWRLETTGDREWRALADAGRPYVLLSWHDALLPLLWQHRGRGITIVVSEAQDGRYLAAWARRLGYREVWGSSTRGGVRALLGAVKALQGGGAAAFTPDGPRGPRRVFKDGALLAAQRGAAPVVVVHAGARRAWRLGSWDRLLVPEPFARVRIAYGTPFEVAAGEPGLAAARARVLAELAHAVREVRWDDAATPTG